MEKPMFIASCSFGKDSIATILLALEHNEPMDRVVFAEVMFDHSRGISGEIPEHIDWIYKTAIPKLESMGVKVDVVKGKKDYMYFFFKCLRRGVYKGKLYGFPMGGMCIISSYCKINPIHAYYKQFKGQKVFQYVGIAKDEPKRLARLKDNQISLLDKYGYTEEDTKELCKKYDLLSPIYESGTRGGCWFCPNGRLCTMRQFRQKHRDLWGELEKLAKTPNLCSYGFKYGQTVEQINEKLDAMDAQPTLF